MDDCIVYTLGTGALIVLTLFSTLRCVLAVLPHCIRSDRFESSAACNRWWFVHKRMALLHYLLLVPLFELFVTWGATMFGDDRVKPIAANVQLAALAFLIASCLVLVVACATRRSYRMMIYTMQNMELQCVATYFCERIVNTGFGGESVVVAALLVCSLIEVFTVPDFFSHYHPPQGQDEAKQMVDFARATPQWQIETSGDDMISHEVAARSLELSMKDLSRILRESRPETMNVLQLRELIDKCRRRLDEVDMQPPKVGGPSPRLQPPPPPQQHQRSHSEYAPLPVNSMTGIGTGQSTMPIGVGARYQRQRDEPEC